MGNIPQFAPSKKLTVHKALQQLGTATSTTLVKMTGKAPDTVKQTLKTLYTTNKIHISAYEATKRGKIVRVWAFGDGADAKEPPMLRYKEEFVPRPDVAAAWMNTPIED